MLRPAFLDRFLRRLPDPRALRNQVVGWTGLVAGSFGALLVLAAVQLDARRCAEVARERAETLAATAGVWLDGDAHAGLGQDPGKRLADLTASLEAALSASGYDGVVRTLRPKADAKAALTAQPRAPRAGALEVVIQTGPNRVHQDVDYRPEMRAAFFEQECASVVQAGRVEAFAPVPDSWGTSPAIVFVQGPAGAPLWRQAAFLVAASLLAGLLVSFAVWIARRRAERLERVFAALNGSVLELSRGALPAPIAAPRHGPRELVHLAGAIEAVRSRLEAMATGQPLPAAPAAATGIAPALRAVLGEASEFDLGLLVQQLAEPARKSAHARKIDFQLVFPDGLPSQLSGHPVALFQALDGLLRNALRVTERGQVTLRVARAGEAPEGFKLRFEVSDTGPGIAFNQQQELSAALARSADLDPKELKDPLQHAGALARALGGELGFESQPGQGSRFGFTVAFQAVGPRPVTAFQPRTVTTILPRRVVGKR